MNKFCYEQDWLLNLRNRFIRIRRKDTEFDEIYLVSKTILFVEYNCTELGLVDDDMKESSVFIWPKSSTIIDIELLT